jgi:hypothetical protein
MYFMDCCGNKEIIDTEMKCSRLNKFRVNVNTQLFRNFYIYINFYKSYDSSCGKMRMESVRHLTSTSSGSGTMI